MKTDLFQSCGHCRVFQICLPDLNELSYDYTVEVTNRFKGIDLIDRVPEELCKKDLHNPDNHISVIIHLEPDILECEV